MDHRLGITALDEEREKHYIIEGNARSGSYTLHTVSIEVARAIRSDARTSYRNISEKSNH